MALIELSRTVSVEEDDLVRYAWTTGEFLEERLDPLQLELDAMFDSMAPRTRAFILESRKIGKTYGFMCYADKIARRKPKSIIRFAYPTKTQGGTIVGPLMEEMQADCPMDLRWVYREKEFCWMLPHNGSRLYLAGTDDADQIERLRGPKADLILLDELPTFRDKKLEYLIDSVLWPQTLNTGGLTLMSGTPPESMDHPSVDYIDQARFDGNLVTKTIFDNPRLDADTIRSICRVANPAKYFGLQGSPAEYEQRITDVLAGKAEGTPHWEREFMCRMVADKEQRVCPEFDKISHIGVAPTGYPCLKFVFIDPGHVKDFFAATFCEMSFSRQILYVRQEAFALRKSTTEIREKYQKIERELGWTTPQNLNPKDVFRYIDETSKQQITDFSRDGYRVQAASRSPGKGQLVVEARKLFNADRIIIDPRCQNLIACCENGIWSDKSKEDFKRTSSLGHLDVFDSLCQGCLTVRDLGKWKVNPYPKGMYGPEDYVPGMVQLPPAMVLDNNKSLGYHLSKMLPSIKANGRRK